MTETIKKLAAKINGSLVMWTHKDWPGLYLEAIFLCPPNGIKVSVKPYGYDPEELYMLLNDKDEERHPLEKFDNPQFCFSTHATDNERRLEQLALIPEWGVYDFRAITGHGGGWSDPSCPY